MCTKCNSSFLCSSEGSPARLRMRPTPHALCQHKWAGAGMQMDGPARMPGGAPFARQRFTLGVRRSTRIKHKMLVTSRTYAMGSRRNYVVDSSFPQRSELNERTARDPTELGLLVIFISSCSVVGSNVWLVYFAGGSRDPSTSSVGALCIVYSVHLSMSAFRPPFRRAAARIISLTPLLLCRSQAPVACVCVYVCFPNVYACVCFACVCLCVCVRQCACAHCALKRAAPAFNRTIANMRLNKHTTHAHAHIHTHSHMLTL